MKERQWNNSNFAAIKSVVVSCSSDELIHHRNIPINAGMQTTHKLHQIHVVFISIYHCNVFALILITLQLIV